jgi:hypothetical protein
MAVLKYASIDDLNTTISDHMSAYSKDVYLSSQLSASLNDLDASYHRIRSSLQDQLDSTQASLQVRQQAEQSVWSDIPSHAYHINGYQYIERKDYMTRTYLQSLRSYILSSLAGEQKWYGSIRDSDLVITDNAYGGQPRDWSIDYCEKGMGIKYHPTQFSIAVNGKLSDDALNGLVRLIDQTLQGDLYTSKELTLIGPSNQHQFDSITTYGIRCSSRRVLVATVSSLFSGLLTMGGVQNINDESLSAARYIKMIAGDHGREYVIMDEDHHAVNVHTSAKSFAFDLMR